LFFDERLQNPISPYGFKNTKAEVLDAMQLSHWLLNFIFKTPSRFYLSPLQNGEGSIAKPNPRNTIF